LDLPIEGGPIQSISESPKVTSVALLPYEYIGVKPELLVVEGDTVKLGQSIFRDRNQPTVQFTSPIAGVINEIVKGERQRIKAIVIRRQADDEVRFDSWSYERLPQISTNVARNQLLSTGLWTAFRTRPFGRIPSPEMAPSAIYVTAIDTNPLAVNPAPIIESELEAFKAGLIIVGKLTEGTVYVCTARALQLSETDGGQICQAVFSGPHPAGLVGTHIHFLTPLHGDRTVWYLHYQDVIAIGRLFTTGRLSSDRVISLAGPSVRTPRLLRVPSGARTQDIVNNELLEGKSRVISGSVLSGRDASGPQEFLGRYHWQVSVLNNDPKRLFLGWLSPGLDRFSATGLFLSRILPKRLYPMTTALNGSPRAIVPIGSYEKVMPMDLLITPLLKALLTSDTETARSLGCLELEEDDLALCSYVCCSKYDFGAALRDVLDAIEKTG